MHHAHTYILLRTNHTHAPKIVNNSNYNAKFSLNDQNCEDVASRDSDDEEDTAYQEEPPKLKSYKELGCSCSGRSVPIQRTRR